MKNGGGPEPFPKMPEGPDAFWALAHFDWKDGKVPWTYNPWVTGHIYAGETAQLTWTPPPPATLKWVTLRAPDDCWVRSLKVGDEETVDPRQPLPWCVLGETAKRHDLGLPISNGTIITMVLERIDPRGQR